MNLGGPGVGCSQYGDPFVGCDAFAQLVAKFGPDAANQIDADIEAIAPIQRSGIPQEVGSFPRQFYLQEIRNIESGATPMAISPGITSSGSAIVAQSGASSLVIWVLIAIAAWYLLVGQKRRR